MNQRDLTKSFSEYGDTINQLLEEITEVDQLDTKNTLLKMENLNEPQYDTTLDIKEVDSNKDANKSDAEFMKEMFQNEEFRNMWIKMHTPWTSKIKTGTFGHKTGRNEICPYCTSGKKFKNCKCYENYKADSFITSGSEANI